MTHDEVAKCMAAAYELFPKWEFTPRQKEVYEKSLLPFRDPGLVIWSFEQERMSSGKYNDPNMERVCDRVRAEYARRGEQNQLGTRDAEREEERQHDLQVLRERAQALEWIKGKSDEEIVRMIVSRDAMFAGITKRARAVRNKKAEDYFKPGMSSEERAKVRELVEKISNHGDLKKADEVLRTKKVTPEEIAKARTVGNTALMLRAWDECEKERSAREAVSNG